ncbi:Ig-like domain repeat protein [Streptomyces sp. NA02950]|uniref:beta strand repeat-containing protein n=1 Tax=Streptomyces sp. NA02950 TaxID=2742137 RepID=UPI001592532A|nr:Ig-like domain-containing protein [Streptomyces sp. NA02950]QKV95037.1 Ig-like domain repeat protein [Streptomyces sp. NA02950]
MPASSTSVISTPNPSLFGQSVTYTATVTDPLSVFTPDGEVTFVISGGPTLGPVTVNASGQASVTDASLAVGSHLVTANYANDTNLDPSSGTTIQQVNQAATVTTITFVPASPVCGESVTVTANVAAVPPGSGTPTGTVTFIVSADGPTMNGTLDASGNASVTFPGLSVGTHQVAAFYLGDTNFAASNSPLTPLTIGQGASTTVFSSPTVSPVCGDAVQLCAQVTVDSPSTCSVSPGTVTFVVAGGPTLSAAVDAAGNACVTTSAIPVGTHGVTATYSGNTDVAGSADSTGSVTIGQGVSTTVFSSPTVSPVCGDAVQLCAQVTSSGSCPVSPGTVTFVVAGGPTLSAAVDAAGNACVTTSAIPVGTHGVTATYSGNTDVAGSADSTGSVTIGQGVSTTVFSSPTVSPVCGDAVQLCAQVTSSGSCPVSPGTVTFVVAGGPTLSAAVDAAGNACVTTSAIPVGTHGVTATYSGNTDVVGSAGTGSVTIGQGVSTTVFSSPTVSPVCGDAVQLCAQVTSSGSCPVSPGTVTFVVAGGPTLSAAVDAAGNACVTTSAIPVGTHGVTATYSGNTDVVGSAGTGSVTIGQGVSTTAVVATPTSSVCGQQVILCAHVTSSGSCPVSPGTVTFVVAGGPTLSAAVDAAGNACVTTSAIPVGTHGVTATYSGNTGVSGSSGSTTLTVNQATSTTALTIAPPSTVCGGPVQLCAQVTVASPGTCTPNPGTVTFAITGGPTLTGTVNASGQACVTTGPLAVGSYPVTVTYSGNTGVAGSSTTGTITVVNANTTTTLTSSPNPSAPGQTVTFTATVAAVPPATGTPTGTVTFTISGGPTLTGTLNGSGVATVSTNALTAGPHTVTATYSGDGCFNGSTSNTITQNVGAATNTTLTANPATIRLRFNGTLVIPTLSATLRDASNNPVPGQTITFVANSSLGPISLGSAVTNIKGTATRSNVTVPPTVLTASTYTASFAGAPGLSPASANASLTFQPYPLLP